MLAQVPMRMGPFGVRWIDDGTREEPGCPTTTTSSAGTSTSAATAGSFHAGRTPRTVSDDLLFDRLLGEFTDWLAAARSAGVV